MKMCVCREKGRRGGSEGMVLGVGRDGRVRMQVEGMVWGEGDGGMVWDGWEEVWGGDGGMDESGIGWGMGS